MDLGGRPLFTPRGSDYKLAHKADRSCVFLGADGLCRIHAKYGSEAKPLACRMYPFRLIPLGSQVRVDLRFDCPIVSANKGRPIAEHAADLRKLLKVASANSDRQLAAPPLFGRVAMTWPQLVAITAAFERVLWDVSLDLTRRVTACINMSALLRDARIAELSGNKLDEFLDEVASNVQQTAIGDALPRTQPHRIERAVFRQMITIHARYDQVGVREPMLKRMATTLGMLAGRGTVPELREGFPRVEFAATERSMGTPSGDAAAAIERYLHVHLTGMGFFGAAFYQRSYLDGLNALLLTYPMICWIARAFAAGDSLSAPDVSCIERSLMIVDHQHGVTPTMNMPVTRSRSDLLHDRAILRRLVIWYGS